MDEVYFWHQYGLHNRSLPAILPNTEGILERTHALVIKLLDNDSGSISFFPNIATATSEIVSSLPKPSVLYHPHDLQWNATLFGEGILDSNQWVFTYPNRFFETNSSLKKPSIQKIQWTYRVWEAETMRDGDILYISAISRLTGERLMDREKYQIIKQRFPGSIVMVDGAQMVGAVIEDVSQFSDIFLGLSSKFIGANPHIVFAWISPEILQRFPQLWDVNSVDPREYRVDYEGLIYHGDKILQKADSNLLQKEILSRRTELLSILKENGYSVMAPPSQAPNFITFSVWDEDATQRFEQTMKEHRIILSSTLWNWSFENPQEPLIRMGINYETTKEDINLFSKVLKRLRLPV